MLGMVGWAEKGTSLNSIASIQKVLKKNVKTGVPPLEILHIRAIFSVICFFKLLVETCS